MPATRLISSDSHVAISQDQVKAHFAPKWHTEHDDAVAEFGRLMMTSGAAKMNQAMLDLRPHPSAGRPGYSDPAARLEDMDADGVDADLQRETAVLEKILDGLDDADWLRPTPAPGWTVADQLSHLAHADESAVLAATDRDALEAKRAARGNDVDAFTARVVQDHRHLAPAELRAWFGPEMSAAAQMTARTMETWAHGREVPQEPVRVELVGVDGDVWEWGPPDAANRVTGDAGELCLVATQRRDLADTNLVKVGRLRRSGSRSRRPSPARPESAARRRTSRGRASSRR